MGKEGGREVRRVEREREGRKEGRGWRRGNIEGSGGTDEGREGVELKEGEEKRGREEGRGGRGEKEREGRNIICIAEYRIGRIFR